MYNIILSTSDSIQITKEQAEEIVRKMDKEAFTVILNNIKLSNGPKKGQTVDLIINVKHIVAIVDESRNIKSIFK